MFLYQKLQTYIENTQDKPDFSSENKMFHNSHYRINSLKSASLANTA